MSDQPTLLSQIPGLDSAAPLVTAVQEGLKEVMDLLPADAQNLLGDLTGQVSAIQELLPENGGSDWIAGLEQGYEQLSQTIPTDAAGILQPALDGLGGIAGLVDQSHLGQILAAAGNDENLADAITGRLPELTTPFLEQLSHFSQQVLPDEQIAQVQAFLDSVTAFRANIPDDPQQIAAFLAENMFSLPAEVVEPLSTLNRGVIEGLAGLTENLSRGLPDTTFDRARQALNVAASLTQGLDPTQAAGYDSIQVAMDGAQTQLSLATSTVQDLLNQIDDHVDGLDLNNLQHHIRTAVSDAPAVDVVTVNHIRQIILDFMQPLIAQMETLDPQVAVDRLRMARQEIVRGLESMGLNQARQTVFAVFDQIQQALEAIPVEAIRDAIQSLFNQLEDVLGSLDITALQDTIRGVFEQVTTAIQQLNLSGVITTVTGLIEQLAGMLDELPLEELVSGLEGIFQTVNGLLDTLVEIAQTAQQALQPVLEALDELDFSQASQPAIEGIRTVQETLASIDLSLLPDALREPLNEAVQPLRELDFEGEITRPLLDAFDQVAALPGEAADEIDAKLDRIVEKIGELDPTGLLQPVQEVFDQLLGAVDGLDPSTLLRPVREMLEQLGSALDQLDPNQLFAPLQAAFDDLLAALERFDPQALFAPLAEAFDQVKSLLDRLDLTPVFDELQRLQQELFGEVQNTLVDTLNLSELPGGQSLLDKMGPLLGSGSGTIRPGDLFLALEDLYDQVVEALDVVPPDRLVDAFNAVRGALAGGLAALHPQELAQQINSQTAAMPNQFAALNPQPLFQALIDTHQSLVSALNAIAADQVPDALRPRLLALRAQAADLNPSGAFSTLQTEYNRLLGRVQELAHPIDLSGLEEACALLRDRLSVLIPESLHDEITPANLRAAIEASNPASIADEINALFDQFQAAAARMAGVLEAEVQVLGEALSENLFNLSPDGLKEAFEEIFNTVKGKLAALDPAVLVEGIADLYATVKENIGALNPAVLSQGVAGAFQALKDQLAALDLGPVEEACAGLFERLKMRLNVIDPGAVSAAVCELFAGIQQRLEGLDITSAIQALSSVLTRLRDELAAVLETASGAFDGLLDAIPA